MQPQTKWLGRCGLVLLTLAVIPKVVHAADYRLQIVFHTIAWGGSCEPGFPNVVAGSRFFLRVTNKADQPAQPLVPGWPEGYVLEAALDRPEGGPFLPTPGLMERLSPTRILGILNREADFRLQHIPSNFDEHVNLNAKHFVLTIPADLAGHTLDFRARYEGKGVSLVSEPTGPIRIVAPCNASDTARIVATQILEASDVGNYPRILALADSMLSCGLTDAAAWDYAMNIARGMEQYDKALIYLQRMYEDFGVLGTTLNASNPPRLNREGSRDPRIQELYEAHRSQLLELKAEYEQRQQQK